MTSAVEEQWPTAEAFYRERDDRTQLAVNDLATYADRPVEIWIDPVVVESIAVQRLALIAANLTARWARRIRVIAPNVCLARPLARHEGTLHERLHREMRDADPFGRFAVVAPLNADAMTETRDDSLRLFVGPWRSAAALGVLSSDDYVVDAGGWSAYGTRGRSRPGASGTGEATVPAAALAAAIGAADLFKRAIGHPQSEWLPSFAWSSWDHQFMLGDPSCRGDEPPVPAILDAGHLMIAGLGAIGSALVYLLDLMPSHGILGLLDRDVVETSNLNRSPLFTAAHVIGRRAKIDAAATHLDDQQWTIELYAGRWREHWPVVRRAGYDVWIALVNEDAAWAEMPFQCPPVIIHGTTTHGWGFGMGRHVPGRDDCTLCRMPQPAAVFRGPCAEGDVAPVHEPPVVASLPFLSTAAAALVFADFLAGRLCPDVERSNDVAADLRLGLPTVIASDRRANAGCRGCRAGGLGRGGTW